ncbi:MAG: Lrp/AsnC family transcriptional regulator [Methylocystaceae bacterium]
MDALDEQIINILKGNGRMPASEIGKLINLSIPAVTERMRKLERSGVITGYTVCLDHAKLGYNLQAFILVTVEGTTQTSDFRQQVLNQLQVLECHHITGEYDYLLKVLVENTLALETFITSTLKTIKGVIRSNTIVVLSTPKAV